MITMEAPAEEQIAQDRVALANVQMDPATLRPLFRRALERAQSKLDAGQPCTSMERDILGRLASA